VSVGSSSAQRYAVVAHGRGEYQKRARLSCVLGGAGSEQPCSRAAGGCAPSVPHAQGRGAGRRGAGLEAQGSGAQGSGARGSGEWGSGERGSGQGAGRRAVGTLLRSDPAVFVLRHAAAQLHAQQDELEEERSVCTC